MSDRIHAVRCNTIIYAVVQNIQEIVSGIHRNCLEIQGIINNFLLCDIICNITGCYPLISVPIYCLTTLQNNNL